jgi:uncharacterized membrane protein
MNLKNNMWFVYAIAAAFFWGVWGVMAKIVSDDVSPFMNHILFTVGMLFTLPFVFKKAKQQTVERKGIIWGLASGALAVGGNLAVYKAFASGGLAAIVIPVSNLYPMVTIAIAILLLKEKMHWLNGIGVLVAVPAIVVLSGETLLFSDPKTFIANLGLNPWLMFSVVALLFWGLFSAAQKITTNYISAEWSYIIFIISSATISLGFMVFGQADLQNSKQTIILGSIAGMLNGLGVLASFIAYGAEGKASKVTTIAGALQPVFTIIFAIIFLSESLSLLEFFGISIAIIAALMLSYEKPVKTITSVGSTIK